MDTKRYVAFLRGINISGKNKVPMVELKKGFEKLDGLRLTKDLHRNTFFRLNHSRGQST